MAYQRIRYRVSSDCSEPLSQAMEQCHALAVTIENAGIEPHFDLAGISDPCWQDVYVTGLFPDTQDPLQLHQHICACDTPGVDHHIPPLVQPLAEQDWAVSFRQYFTPLRVATGLWICPSWTEPPEPEAVNIVLDPGLAFGTGTHPTTAMCLAWLAGADLAGKQVLDFGCGSGILAIAALKLGAGSAIAVDVDPRALTTTRANAEANKTAESLQVMTPEQLPAAQRADVVVANILAEALVELAPSLTRKLTPDGTILLSGILKSQLGRVQSAYNSEFSFAVTQLEQWCLLVGERRTGSADRGRDA